MNEKDKFPSSFASTQFVKYVDRKEIKTIVETLGHAISQKYAGQELVLVGVLKGSMTFMADLVRSIQGVRVYVDFVKLQSVGRSKESAGNMRASGTSAASEALARGRINARCRWADVC